MPINHVCVVGRLTRDIELRYTPQGTAVADLGLAINEREKQGGEWVDVPVFVECTLWGRTAEVANDYLGKGKRCGIVGKLKLEQWESNGQKRSKLKIVARELELLEPRDQSRPSVDSEPADDRDPYRGANPRQQRAANENQAPDDNIPF